MKKEIALEMNDQIDFGNWMPAKMIAAPALLALLCFWLGFAFWPLWLAAALFALMATYFGAARHIFTAGGGNLQERVQQLVIERIQWDGAGKLLDVGCGSGALAIMAARRFPRAQVTGVDSWGKSWDYSLKVYERNARLCGLSDRISFRKASATALPFEDASFNVVISNLVFHEVREAADKREPVREALRVLKPGSVFVLQDLFLLKPYYGTPQELMDKLRLWGMAQVEFKRTCDQDFIPGFVKLPFMLGTLAILRGTK